MGLFWGLGFDAKQTAFDKIIVFFIPAFVIYVWLNFRVNNQYTVYFWVIGSILIRLLLVFAFPNLSDDIYRFIWDGHLIRNGYNPFLFQPQEIRDGHFNIPGLTTALFQALNSQQYYTVYPPIAQFTFWLAVFLAPESWYWNAVLMKIWLFFFEIGSILLLIKILKHYGKPTQNVLWYALNPLILIEITGNLHFEGGMIFFLLLGYWLLLKQKMTWAATAMAASIASKLIPLIFMPLMIQRLGWKNSLRFFLIVGITLLLLFFPLLNQTFFSNFGTSLELYFRNFEFNGGIYYALRWIGYQTEGYNLIKYIGPRLGILVFILVMLYTVLERNPNLERFPLAALFAICVYLFLGTTIHPWYTSLPIALCLFTPFRFPIVWSGMIMFTYINYSYGAYQENLWVVLIEYLVVYGVLIWEVYHYIIAPKNDPNPQNQAFR